MDGRGRGRPLSISKHMDDAVKKAFETMKGRYGSLGLTRDLADAGQQYDRKSVAASMGRQGLRLCSV